MGWLFQNVENGFRAIDAVALGLADFGNDLQLACGSDAGTNAVKPPEQGTLRPGIFVGVGIVRYFQPRISWNYYSRKEGRSKINTRAFFGVQGLVGELPSRPNATFYRSERAEASPVYLVGEACQSGFRRFRKMFTPVGSAITSFSTSGGPRS